MTNEQKIELANAIIDLMSGYSNSKDFPIKTGELNKAQGIKGFKTAEIGHTVFEYKDRYIIYLESNDGKTTISVPYYKEDLKRVIDFI